MNLNEFIDNQVAPEDGFKVNDESKANWALRKIKELQEEKEKNIAFAEKEISNIDLWLSQENEKAQRDIDYFQGLLSAYALEKRDEDPKFKSLKLPNGSIRFKKQQPAFKYDNAALLDYLKKSEETDLIRIKEEPNKSAIKKLFIVQDDSLINPNTGEIVEGVTIEKRDDKFEVVINE